MSIKIRIYQDARGAEPFLRWLNAIPSKEVQLRIRQRLRRIEEDNLGDYKPVGGGVCEFRLPFGPGYRIYFGFENKKLILLLLGGDKGSQQADIKKAKAYWQEYKENCNASI